MTLDASPARLEWVSRRAPDLPLNPKLERISIGRSPGNEITLPDPEASAVHARLETQAGHWLLSDVSKHGTRLRSVDEPPELLRGATRRLRHGDMLVFGSSVLRFFSEDGPEETGTLEPSRANQVVIVTDRQDHVLEQLALPIEGDAAALPASNKEIAAALFISTHAVRNHLAELYHRFQIPSGPPMKMRFELARQRWRARVGRA